jgi:hypothetical protein
MPHINSGLEVIISLLSSRLIGDTQVTSEAEENTNVEAVAAAKETTIVQFKTIIPDDIRFTKGGICGRYMPCRLPDPGKNEEVAVVILEAIKSQQIVESKAIEGAVTTRTGSCIIEASKEDVISAIGLGPVETQWMEMLKFLLDGELRNRLVNGEKPEDLVMPTDIVPLTFTFDIYPHLIDPTKSDVFLNFISKHTQPEVSTELRFTVPNELLLRFFNREIGFEEILETIISIEKVDNLIRELDEGEVDEQGVNQKVDISTVLTNLGLYIEVLYNCIALSQEIPIQWHEVANGITSPEKHFNLPIEVIGDTST